MPSVLSWKKMVDYRRDYNLRYLEVMRNSGYDIQFKLEFDYSRPHNWRWQVHAYVNGKRVVHWAVFGYSRPERPPTKAIRTTYHRLLNQLLSATPAGLMGDNSSEQSKTNQQRTATHRDGGVRVVEERRPTNSGTESARNKQTTLGLYAQRADDCISAALNAKHVRNTLVGMVQAGQCIRRRIAILANGKRR